MTTPLNPVLSRPSHTALLITSDTDLASVVEHAMGGMSVKCVTTNTMFKAAQFMQNGVRPVVILIDLSAEQAIKFIRELKAHATFAKIPVLALTEDPSLPAVKNAIEAGANRWITKSFIGNTLFAVVRQLAII